MNRLPACVAQRLAMPMALIAAMWCVAAPAAALELVGADFPQLLAQTPLAERERLPADSVPTPAQITAACAHVRALPVSELEGAWAHAVEAIEFTCQYEPDDLGDGLVTSTKARLRAGAVRFLGTEVVEVRLQASDWGWDHQYVLAGEFARDGEALIENIHRLRCRGNAASCDIHKGEFWMHDGFYIDTMEGGGTWLHAAEDDPRRMIYAEAWSE